VRAALVSAAVALALVVVAVGCGTVGRTEEGEGSATAGRQLFVENCGSCHVLEAAGTQGTIGPNLDDAFAEVRREGWQESTVRDVVRGQIAYPVVDPPTGEPGMPANLVTGEDADDVAAFVAAAVFNPASAGGGAGESGRIQATGGEEIFAEAGCGGCHTFSAAGTTGEVGPNLDESQPSLQLAIDRVTNGGEGMPSFRDRMSDEQIRAVADFVSRGAR
jgi:cbb3-type cytochrome c oxidase subunit III